MIYFQVVQVTTLVKYSNSSVDILSCFEKVGHILHWSKRHCVSLLNPLEILAYFSLGHQITAEWRQIDFNDADIAILGVTKITDVSGYPEIRQLYMPVHTWLKSICSFFQTICDGVKWYVEKVMIILENNGYYDYIDNQQFDVTDQVCVVLLQECIWHPYLFSTVYPSTIKFYFDSSASQWTTLLTSATTCTTFPTSCAGMTSQSDWPSSTKVLKLDSRHGEHYTI